MSKHPKSSPSKTDATEVVKELIRPAKHSQGKRRAVISLEDEMVLMAADPDIRREIDLIEKEFAIAGADGLIDEQ